MIEDVCNIITTKYSVKLQTTGDKHSLKHLLP